MLSLKKLIQSFEEIIGWPYVSPGTNDKNGIDCSGAFVRAYKAQGGSIYHGSNRIIRVHCRDVWQVASASQLAPGMAVFKRREDGTESADYKPGGRYYDPTLTGNFYHIGLVCSVNPLKIIHASTPVAKADTALGTWSWAGYLKEVDYGTALPGNPSGADAPAGEPDIPYDAAVDVGNSERGLNFRVQPAENAARVAACKEIPNGALLTVLEYVDSTWAKVNYAGTFGYVMRKFLKRYTLPEPEPGDDSGDAHIITVSTGELEYLYSLIQQAREHEGRTMAALDEAQEILSGMLGVWG